MDFYRRMNLVCLRIPAGTVATYGQIALLCGMPGHARQVGYGLKLGLAGADVPAHRVVNSKGELSGAGYFETPDLQKLLLKTYRWKNTMEEAVMLEKIYKDKEI